MELNRRYIEVAALAAPLAVAACAPAQQIGPNGAPYLDHFRTELEGARADLTWRINEAIAPGSEVTCQITDQNAAWCFDFSTDLHIDPSGSGNVPVTPGHEYACLARPIATSEVQEAKNQTELSCREITPKLRRFVLDFLSDLSPTPGSDGQPARLLPEKEVQIIDRLHDLLGIDKKDYRLELRPVNGGELITPVATDQEQVLSLRLFETQGERVYDLQLNIHTGALTIYTAISGPISYLHNQAEDKHVRIAIPVIDLSGALDEFDDLKRGGSSGKVIALTKWYEVPMYRNLRIKVLKQIEAAQKAGDGTMSAEE